MQGRRPVALAAVWVGAAQAQLVDARGVAHVARDVQRRLAHRVDLGMRGMRVRVAKAQRTHHLRAPALARNVLRRHAVGVGAVGVGAEQQQLLDGAGVVVLDGTQEHARPARVVGERIRCGEASADLRLRKPVAMLKRHRLGKELGHRAVAILRRLRPRQLCLVRQVRTH